MNIYNVINELKRERPIFHSEADFQFALAWKIQKLNPDVEVRLEYTTHFTIHNKPAHIDIVVFENGKAIPIELKYKTLSTEIPYKDESFALKNHGAQDLGRYDYLLDIERIEACRASWDACEGGYAIMLSNDPSYWKPNMSSRKTVCDQFRIHHGVEKTGILHWENAGIGTTKGREDPIALVGRYPIFWSEYSCFGTARSQTFMITITEI